MKKSAKLIFAIFITSAMLCGCNNITDNNSSIFEPQHSIVQQSSSQSEISVSSYTELSGNSENTYSVYNLEKKYFVNKLDDDMLEKFTTLYNAISNFQPYVSFENTISNEELDTLMYLLNYDCPELIHLSGTYFPEYISNNRAENVSAVTFEYIMSEEEYTDNIARLKQFFTDLKSLVGEKSEFEKEKYVYDLLFSNTIYNETDTLSGSACGVLLKGKGRCEALCKSFLWCMQELDIECMALLGEPKWEVEAVFSNHSWNIVKIDGNYYHLDLTVDNLPKAEDETSPVLYGFFNVDDTTISETHTINPIYESLGVPECNSTDANYHIMNGLYISEGSNTEEALSEILFAYFDNGLDNISVKFESYDDYCGIVESMDNYLPYFLQSISVSDYTYTTVHNDLAHTISFDVQITE